MSARPSRPRRQPELDGASGGSRKTTIAGDGEVGGAGFSVWVEGKPVSVNAAYGARARFGRYLTAEAHAWRLAVYAAIRIQQQTQQTQQQPAQQRFTAEQLPLRVHCTFYAVRGDADNYLKLTLDGLKAALGVDDRHFSPVTAEVVRGRAQGQVARIEVSAIGDELRG